MKYFSHDFQKGYFFNFYMQSPQTELINKKKVFYSVTMSLQKIAYMSLKLVEL